MAPAKAWTIRSFLSCFICNGVLVVFLLRSRSIPEEVATPLLLAGGAVLTILLWLLILYGGRSLARPIPAEPIHPAVLEGPSSSEAATRMLALLQREGRLIDFLQEDLGAYEDSQIGAAVRDIHAGCREALREHVEIEPVLEEKEGDRITVPAGFDAKAIRLTGNVSGNPPFRGILRHRGWQAVRIHLPQLPEERNHWILAPAEVEIE